MSDEWPDHWPMDAIREVERAEEQRDALKARLATATQLAENTAAGLAATTTRLAEAEREQDTLLAMIRHQRDVLRECLPYLNESMAGRRPGRSADDIRAAVKALTTDSAPAVLHNRRWSDGEPEITTHASEKDKEVARMIRDHQKIIDAKRKSCPKCYGTGAIDAPTSADDPSCPDCDGEGHV